MKKFTRVELARCNGNMVVQLISPMKVQIAFYGKKGKHQVTQKAGEDLTDALKDAPNGTKELGFNYVGVLV